MKSKHRQFHYFYKITNNINNHFYYGVHNTDNLEDGYMGSGKRLHYAYKKYGIENFTKEILKFFDTAEEAFKYESEVVTENLVMDLNCYNIQLGGKGFCSAGLATVKDKDGNIFYTSVDDPRLKTGELVGCNTGKGIYKHKITGERMFLPVNDPKVISGEYIGVTTGLAVVKDKHNNYYSVSIDDPRLLSGELTHIWKGRKHSKETILKQKEIFKHTKHLQGEKNSLYGTCWVTKDLINKKINKSEFPIYELDGWKLGRYVKYIRDFSKEPTYEEIQYLYSILKSYTKVAKYFNMSRDKLRRLCNEYKNM